MAWSCQGQELPPHLVCPARQCNELGGDSARTTGCRQGTGPAEPSVGLCCPPKAPLPLTWCLLVFAVMAEGSQDGVLAEGEPGDTPDSTQVSCSQGAEIWGYTCRVPCLGAAGDDQVGSSQISSQWWFYPLLMPFF